MTTVAFPVDSNVDKAWKVESTPLEECELTPSISRKLGALGARTP